MMFSARCRGGGMRRLCVVVATMNNKTADDNNIIILLIMSCFCWCYYFFLLSRLQMNIRIEGAADFEEWYGSDKYGRMWICAAVRRVCFCMSVPVFRPNPDISFPKSQGFLACLSHFTSKLLAQSYLRRDWEKI